MGDLAAGEEIWNYFRALEKDLEYALELARRARKRGADPSPEPEISIAQDLADRVEKLLGVPGVAERVRSLEKENSREEAALQIGFEIAVGKVGKFKSRQDAIEAAIRVAVAVLTEGVVAAPIEGIARVAIDKNDDGSSYLRIFYAGPIRSAGGTAQALSVLVADYVRRSVGIDRYRPRHEEIERYVEEILLYRRTANLQYLPSDEEIRLIVQNCPICIDGEATEDAEVDGYRDLERVGTNRVRGGMALVVAEGLALKAPKIKKLVEKLGLDGWTWLDRLIFAVKTGDDENEKQLKPRDKYLQDLIAGRPVFSYPSRPGGFRLRYGRSRNTSFACAGINPATMILLDSFIAPGTQIKIERPGKAAGIAPVDTIEGPTVRLFNGDVLRIDRGEDALKLRPAVQEILNLGEILVNYGDFLENNHPLVPASYCYEWWIQELEAKTDKPPEEELRDPTQEKALEISDTYKVPLHPKYTYLWHDITPKEFVYLANYISEKGSYDGSLSFSFDNEIKNILEVLLVPHTVRDGRISIAEPLPLIRCLGLSHALKKSWENLEGEIMEMVSRASGLIVRTKAPVRIGGRMGRPEKSYRREMRPAPHILFPLGEAGGRTRSLQDAKDFANSMQGKTGKIKVQVGLRLCQKCGKETFKNRCGCGEYTAPTLHCPACKLKVASRLCPRCGRETTSVSEMEIDFKAEYLGALARLGERDNFSAFKGVIGLTSKNKTPEPLEKGVLRAKHEIFTFKDGTVRYDLSDLPLTHFRPREIGVSIEKMLMLGYDKDMQGNPLEREEQVLELKPQDIVISKDAGDYLLKTACFIDDLLVKYYGVERYYNAKNKEDLIGRLIIGLAPHTSAGVLGRLIGFTSASVGYAHPFFHAAKRRNCDGDEDCVMLLMDGFLNFSKAYLPDKRGGSMDAPLVLTTRIDPNEVDKEAHNIDVISRYPIAFYEATLRYANPKEVAKMMDLISSRLNTPKQFEGFGYTHDTSDIASGPKNSTYKILATMIEKTQAQLCLARKIRAVDARDVAERVINSHFLPDLIGNLRSFSKQTVRCTKCNTKYRRPPLRGNCPKCGGNIVLTVHEGTVRKYLEVSLKIAEEYNVKAYTKQRLELLELEMQSLFQSDKAKQKGLADFM